MASIHTMNSVVSLFTSSRFRELSRFALESDYQVCRRRVLGLERVGIGAGKRIRVSCKLRDGDPKSNDEEPPESLFMKELKRRGISPESLSEESNKKTLNQGIKEKEGDTVFATRNAVSTDSDKSLTNQREVSMALNSEGLEGLVPRAKLLLTLGGTFFLGFGPLILAIVAFFSALYLVSSSIFSFPLPWPIHIMFFPRCL
ncbi:hypothetical protein Dimus_026346 [Dionaea muscipula]